MARFAELDEDNNVLRVIVADQSFIDSGAVGDPSRWIETFKERRSGPEKRYNFAGPGRKYDRQRGAFIPSRPHGNYRLNQSIMDYEPAVPRPNDGKQYYFDPRDGTWKEVPAPQGG